MLTGKFRCPACGGKYFSSEIHICASCCNILCSTCQSKHVDGGTSRRKCHATTRLDVAINAQLSKTKHAKGFADGPVDMSKRKLQQKYHQLASCNAAIREALKKNEGKKQSIERKIKASLQRFMMKFLQMLSNHEKYLQRQLADICHHQTSQLTSILENSEILMKIFDQPSNLFTPQNITEIERINDTGELNEKDNFLVLDRLNVMQLMTSFADAMDGRVKFKSLSEHEMRSALKTLPDLGSVTLHKSQDGPFSSHMWGTKRHQHRPMQTASLFSSEDSIGETDPDFGEFHMGRNLIKISPVRQKHPTYIPKYQIVNQDISVQDEIVLPSIKKEQRPQSAGKANMFKRMQNPFRKPKNFSEQKFSNGPIHSQPAVGRSTEQTKTQHFRRVRFLDVEEKRYATNSEHHKISATSLRSKSAPHISETVRTFNGKPRDRELQKRDPVIRGRRFDEAFRTVAL